MAVIIWWACLTSPCWRFKNICDDVIHSIGRSTPLYVIWRIAGSALDMGPRLVQQYP
jgi:hypothetical protein